MATRTVYICDTCKRESETKLPYRLTLGATVSYSSYFDGAFCTIACGLEFARLYLEQQTPKPAPPEPAPKKRWFKRGAKR